MVIIQQKSEVRPFHCQRSDLWCWQYYFL